MDRSQKFCFRFFGKDKECTQENCPYNHNRDEYLVVHDLKKCPNCENLCKTSSKICSNCVSSWLDRKKDIEIKQCGGLNCTEMTRFKYCRQCNEVIRNQIL
jgi:hypothetical protein